MKNIYKIIFLLILNSTFSIHNSFSQTAPAIQWQNTIGGTSSEELWSIKQTVDGGFLLGGMSSSGISGDKTENSMGGSDYWIVKTDLSGNIQWQNSIGGSLSEYLTSMDQTSDGGFILGGYSYSNISGDKSENCLGQTDYWIVKTDGLGNVQWENTIGGDSAEFFGSIEQTSDNGYIIGGSSNSNISDDKTENSRNNSDDYWILKLDSSGSIEWQKTIGGDNTEDPCAIHQTIDGGYILCGSSRSDISGEKTENSNGYYDYWIVKTDSLGNIQWENTIGGSNYDLVHSIEQTNDGGFILGGFSRSDISGDKTENSNGSYDYWIIKTDIAGNIEWQNTIGGAADDELQAIQQTNDNGYIFAGFSDSNISGDKTENTRGANDYWIIKSDSLGGILWQKTIGGNEYDQPYSILQTYDGGYILGGMSQSDISGEKTENSWNSSLDYWVIKLFPDTITGIPNFQFSTFNYQLTPNPLTTQSKLTFKNPNKEKFLFTLYDITGRVTESVSTTNNEIILTKSSKPAGVYLFNLANEKTGERMNGKIIIAN